MKDRILEARKGFLENDIKKTRISHTLNAIKSQMLHTESHNGGFNLPEIILGGQDGVVNVLGIVLGIAAATSTSQIVLAAGFAATFAESISMAAVAYTSKLAQVDYYFSELEREKWEIDNVPEGEREEIRQLYKKYGFKGATLDSIVDTITRDKKIWLEVMMEQELKLSPVKRSDAVPAAFIVGISSFIGSLIPLFPFVFFELKTAVIVSLTVCACSLFAVGFYKAKITVNKKLYRSGLEMLVIGMVSAFFGYLIGSLFKVSPSNL